MEPVNTGAVDDGWELAGTHSQRGANGRETENNLYVHNTHCMVEYYTYYEAISITKIIEEIMPILLKIFNFKVPVFLVSVIILKFINFSGYNSMILHIIRLIYL